MTRPRLIVLSIIAVILLYGAGTWIANHTEWVENTVALPPKGEAATNPFYAAQRFAEQLGATTTWDRIFIEPSSDAVIVLSTWQWSLSARRRFAIEQWVENGGRLVVDDGIWGGVEEFERWSGIVWEELPSGEDEGDEEDEEAGSGVEAGSEAKAGSDAEAGSEAEAGTEVEAGSEAKAGSEAEAASEETPPANESTGEEDDEQAPWQPKCEDVREERGGPAGPVPLLRRKLCSVVDGQILRAREPLEWALHGEKGLQAVRVRVGRGSVTVINAMPFRVRTLFDGDHAWLLVNATQMKRGDEIHFLSEDEHPGLLTLAWLRGRPVVLLGGLVIALLLWRGAVRFGPLVAGTVLARRSLAEQIRGTGQFVLRGGSGAALHTAMVRALEETVRRRVKGYGDLKGDARISALASVIGDRARAEALAAAMYDADVGTSHGSVLRRTLARIEAARRHVIGEDTKSKGAGRHERRY